MFPLAVWCVVAGILSSLFARKFRREPYRGVPDEAVRFYDRLAKTLAAAHPEIEVVGPTQQGFGAVLRVDRQEIAVPLGEVFLREKAFPDAFDATVSRLATEIRDHLASTQDLLFDEVVDCVLPQIRAEEWIRSNSPAFGPGSLIRVDIFEELSLCFVLDEEDSMVFVTQGHLSAWGIDVAALENLAMNNLRRLAARDGGLPGLEMTEGASHVVRSGDGYDAARMLLALDRGVEDVDGLVFAVPDRDTLVIGRKGTKLSQLMADVDARFERGAHPISRELFEVQDRKLRRLDVGAAEEQDSVGR